MTGQCERREKVKKTYSDIFRMFTLSNADHPQELVNVVTGVTDHATKNNKNIVNVERTHDLVRSTLV